jgi:hypothetical protein
LIAIISIQINTCADCVTSSIFPPETISGVSELSMNVKLKLEALKSKKKTYFISIWIHDRKEIPIDIADIFTLITPVLDESIDYECDGCW